MRRPLIVTLLAAAVLAIPVALTGDHHNFSVPPPVATSAAPVPPSTVLQPHSALQRAATAPSFLVPSQGDPVAVPASGSTVRAHGCGQVASIRARVGGTLVVLVTDPSPRVIAGSDGGLLYLDGVMPTGHWQKITFGRAGRFALYLVGEFCQSATKIVITVR